MGLFLPYLYLLVMVLLNNSCDFLFLLLGVPVGPVCRFRGVLVLFRVVPSGNGMPLCGWVLHRLVFYV